MRRKFVYVVSTAEPDHEILAVYSDKLAAEAAAKRFGAYVTETIYEYATKKGDV